MATINFGVDDDQNFFLVAPETVTAGGGAGTNVFTGLAAEAALYDPAAWNAATNYAVDDEVSYNYVIYIRLTAGVTATAPSADAVNWARVSPINAYKLFDATNSTAAQIDGTYGAVSFEVQMAASRYTNVVILDAVENAQTVQLQAYDGVTPVYNRTITMVGAGVMDEAANPLEFHWAKRTCAVFQDIPGIVDAVDALRLVVTVTQDDLNADCTIGTMMIGNERRIGVATAGFGSGITDRSVKQEDDFGNYNIVERTYQRRVFGTVAVRTPHAEAVQNLLASYRATFAGYMVAGDTYPSMVVLGFFRDFDITVQGPVLSYCGVEILGV